MKWAFTYDISLKASKTKKQGYGIPKKILFLRPSGIGCALLWMPTKILKAYTVDIALFLFLFK